MTNSLGEATEEEKNSSEHRYKEEIKNNSNIQNATRHRIHAGSRMYRTHCGAGNI